MSRMINDKIQIPNFVVLKCINKKGPVYKMTICKNSLQVLDEEEISEIPVEWTIEDFYELLEEGNRFFR